MKVEPLHNLLRPITTVLLHNLRLLTCLRGRTQAVAEVARKRTKTAIAGLFGDEVRKTSFCLMLATNKQIIMFICIVYHHYLLPVRSESHTFRYTIEIVTLFVLYGRETVVSA